MRQYVALLAVYALFPATPAHAHSYAQLALGGSPSSNYAAMLTITNTNATPWRFDCFLVAGLDDTWPGGFFVNDQEFKTHIGFSDTVPANGVRDYLISTNARQTTTGHLDVFPHDTGGSDSGVLIHVMYGYLDLDASSVIDTISPKPCTAGRTFDFPVQRRSDLNVGFAIAPYDRLEPCAITATLYDDLGGYIQQKTIQFNGQMARFFSQIFDNVPNGFLGRVKLEAPFPVIVTVLRMDNTKIGVSFAELDPLVR